MGVGWRKKNFVWNLCYNKSVLVQRRWTGGGFFLQFKAVNYKDVFTLWFFSMSTVQELANLEAHKPLGCGLPNAAEANETDRASTHVLTQHILESNHVPNTSVIQI